VLKIKIQTHFFALFFLFHLPNNYA